jgi:hypothetical protein
MFTFGRRKEIEVVLQRHGGKEKAELIVDVVNSVHDMLEGKTELEHVLAVIEKAIVEGKRDIWDAAGTWLLKMHKSFPKTKLAWVNLSKHRTSEVRYRVASHIIEMPSDIREEIYNILKNDQSKKVREHAEAKWDYCINPGKYT